MDILPVLPEEDLASRVAHAILFPAAPIRVQAIEYFGRTAKPPETIMPRVIQAIEQYGRDHSHELLRRCARLPQTEATVAWICNELDLDWLGEDVQIDNYCCLLAGLLRCARLDLLKESMADLQSFPAELKPGFLERFELARLDWDTLLARLTALGQDVVAGKHTSGFVRHTTSRIVEAMGRHTDKADQVLALVRGEGVDPDDDLMNWLHPHFITIAGDLDLKEMIGDLVQIFQMAMDAPAETAAVKALRHIGGDAVVEAVATLWPPNELSVQAGSADILQDIHTSLSVQRCWDEFLSVHDDNTWRNWLLETLLSNFAAEAMEPAREVLQKARLRKAEPELTAAFLTAATVLGVKVPEYEDWLHELIKHWNKEFAEASKLALRPRFNEAPDRQVDFHDADDWDDWVNDDSEVSSLDEELDDDEWDDDEWDDDEWDDDEWDDDELEDEEDWEGEEGDLHWNDEDEPSYPNKSGAGRNGPCPCGSGKKYKKCCIGKSSASSILYEEASAGPQSSLVRLGPDDRRTTRIIASITLRLNSTPIRREWQGNNLQFNNKVQHEVREFFLKHDVPVPDDSGANKGCPHEAGKDYPAGGDCLQCPFWKGKQ